MTLPASAFRKEVAAVANPQHFTLVANTVKTFTLDADYSEVEVTNLDGAAAVYFTVGTATPAVDADGSHVLPAAIGFLTVQPRTSGPTVVKAISAGTPKISVRGLLP